MKKRRLLRLVTVAAVLCLLLSFGWNVSAEEATVHSVENPFAPDAGSVELHESDRDLTKAKQTLEDGLLAHKDSINLFAYGLTAKEMDSCYLSVLFEHPEIFYVESCSYSMLNNVVVAACPVYRYTAEEAAAYRLLAQDRIDEIVEQVDPTWSKLEIALFLHDYLCANFSYDTTYQNYDMCSLLVEGTGVCQAYYLAYRYILNQFDIPSDYVYSDSMNHIWNLVNLDGKWYHVDATYDDPVPDKLGQALHGWFLRSDSGIAENNAHYDWVTGPLVTTVGDEYETNMWKSIRTAFVPVNGVWYYLDYSYGICSVDVDTGSTSKVSPVTMYWSVPDKPGYVYGTWFSGFYACGEELIYNTAEKVVAYSLRTGQTRAVCQPLLGDKTVFGCFVRDGQITVQLGDTYLDETPSYQTVPMGTVYTAAEWVASVLDSGSVLRVNLTGDQTDQTQYRFLMAYYKDGKYIGMKIVLASAADGAVELPIDPDTQTQFLLLTGDWTPHGDKLVIPAAG